jgi:hypothetical protein
MIQYSYRVEYYVTRTLEGNGEFSKDQIVEKHSIFSVTNDLNEIFTDLFDKHRLESILGLEIIGVIHLDALKEIEICDYALARALRN